MERSNQITITLTINDEKQQVACPPMSRLIDVLRDNLGLTGTKEGCGAGECGACSVIMDGKMVNSCLVPAIQANGTTIHTIEGLAKKPEFTTMENNFHQQGGTQCGFCTPGMMVAAYQLYLDKVNPDRATIRHALAGNLCRCTGHQKIIDSVAQALQQLNLSASEQIKEQGEGR